MKSKVSRWGNSLALRIPKNLAASHQLTEGTDVEIVEEEGGLKLYAVKPGKPTLEELLAGITEENLPPEIDSGDIQGKEAW